MAQVEPTIDGIERGSNGPGEGPRSNSLTGSLPPQTAMRPTMNHRRSLSHNDINNINISRHHMLLNFGSISKHAAYRRIRNDQKREMTRRMGWENYDPGSFKTGIWSHWTKDEEEEGMPDIDESAPLSVVVKDGYQTMSSSTIPACGSEDEEGGKSPSKNVRVSDVTTATEEEGEKKVEKALDGDPFEALKELFLENKVNVLNVFLPLAWYSHHAHWNDAAIFILNFLAMVPLAAMLGVFTEELAAHTNDVIGGLINATFGNAVELVVAIQALLAEEYRVVQASLIGSVFSNLLLVLGMCFLCGGLRYPEQQFIATGAVASTALLGLSGLTLLLPAQFDNAIDEEKQADDMVMISRIGAVLLILMYAQLLFFQLKTHVHIFEGDGDAVEVIPFSWALIGLVVITAIVTILSDYLVGSINGFCEMFNFGRSFVGVIILPIVGNAVEHISAVTVAMKNNMDLALGVAMGSAVQIALFVLPLVVVVGWATGREMTLKFPDFEVYLYLLSVFIVAICLSNQRSNWLEGSLLVSFYIMIAVGIYYEKDILVVQNDGSSK